MDEAISLLHAAYKAISKGDIDYGVNTFLRLPLYLQEAKKPEEAWKEFNNLLAKGFVNQLNNPDLVPMYNSEIYDKMRLFLQREGRNSEAEKYGVFSHFSCATGLFLQKRTSEFKDLISAKTLEDKVLKLLKKAKKPNLSEQISSLIKHEVKNIPNIDYGTLSKKIDKVIS